jgi:glycosyltransferase involved in cell wall biosynthesis
MKILIATDTYYPSVNGASYFTQRLVAMLVKHGHDVSVFAPGKSFKNTVFKHEGATVYGIRSISLPVYPALRISPLFLSRKMIKKYIKEIKPDIIHIQNHFMIGKCAALVAGELGIPVVGTNHFMPENLLHYFHVSGFAARWLKCFGWYQFSKVFSRLDAVTTPTKTAALLIEDLDLGKKIIPISCGIDLDRFNPRNKGEYLRKKYGISEDCPIILYVGRLDKEKRVEDIIRAFANIVNKIKAHLVLAGIGTLRSFFEGVVCELGVDDRVTFTGFIPDNDLPNLYCVAQVFVIAGIAELQSIATMEAMASGLPVVAVNAIALPELVHHGSNGYLFNDGDVVTLAESIIEILSDEKLREQMSKKSLELIQAHDIKKTLVFYEHLYKQTILEYSGVRSAAVHENRI